MYLFRDQDHKEISIRCKLCFKEIKFKIELEEYKSIKEFPFKREFIHGDPPHKLTAFIDKYLDVVNFEIEQLEEEVTVEKKEITNQVLREIGLTNEEIDLYFETTGRETVSLGEIAILLDKPKEECIKVVDKFLKKGLFKRIVSATPHFKALPPYAALVHQLTVFDKYISEIQKEVPPQLQESFSQLESQAEGIRKLKEYTTFMSNLKDNMLKKLKDQKERVNSIIQKIEKIKEIKSSIYSIENNTKQIMNEQLEDLSSKFEGVSENISKGMETHIENLSKDFGIINEKISDMINEQVNELELQCTNIKERVSKNLDKLHLGVLQETVESVIEKLFSKWVIQVSDSLKVHLDQIKALSNDQLVKAKIGLNQQLKHINAASKEAISSTAEEFNRQLITELRNSIEDTIVNINQITESSVKSGEEMKQIFADISYDFNDSVVRANDRITDISDDVLESFGNLKNLFSTKVIDTLENVLDKILEKLETSEATTIQFWQKAKQSEAVTMKDIWFIRSEEAAKAHIKEELVNTKARILIVAPRITDIDIESVKILPRHVNIRISTFIDKNDYSHTQILKQFDEYPNVTFRHRELQNLWGTNRDYEEVIVCVYSKSEGEGSEKAEIAGIGSIIDEHIKIFVPILEEAWLNSTKLTFM